MKNLKKLLLNEAVEPGVLNVLMTNVNEKRDYYEISKRLSRYEKIIFTFENILLARLNIKRKCAYIMKKIYFNDKSKWPDIIYIQFDENDFRDFHKIVYYCLKLYLSIKKPENLKFIFVNHKTNNTKILQNCFDKFITDNNFYMEEIEEYLEENLIYNTNEKKIFKPIEIRNLLKNNKIVIKDDRIEDEISKDAELSYLYAKNVLKGRFPKGEDAIATSAINSLYYAMNIIEGRFPEGEAAISKSAEDSYYYARNVINGRFPEGEAAIATNSYYASKYAIDFINGK